SDSAMRWPTPRASTSGTPPAVVGTRTRMGFDGKSLWPKAFRARKSKTAANPFTSFALRSGRWPAAGCADDRRGDRWMRGDPGDRGAHRVESAAAAEGDEFRRDLVHPGLAVARLVHLVRDEAAALLLQVFAREQARGGRAVGHDRDRVRSRHRQDLDLGLALHQVEVEILPM